ncbi:hypothetical protein ACFQDN_00035 [Pseudomonas asuensis]|jgi:hypothetical protein|uniref:DUF3509 domain-containing protein n=1 Tax=Pseudomonas asuensis TaxID=1825787 RepID=A0ABQ2GGS9_9PSED|nr:hypothetical protein [Pseudomonas asuensis]GGL94561.1 hypothetical protein GCM10009425_01940 [Pseudomonas asuensis]
MTTPLSLDAAQKLVVDAFIPLGCVISANPQADSFGFSVIGQDGEKALAIQEVTADQYGNPLQLKDLIEHVRQALIQQGQALDPWEMPFITDPDALPPPAFN